jgi:hypothetical protein
MTHKSNPALRHCLELFGLTFAPESWRKYLDLIRNQRFQPYFIIAFTLWLVGSVEIVQKTTGQKLDPRFWMLVAIVITAYGGIRIFQLSPKMSNVRRPIRSREVDNLMSRIVSSGFAVYHEPATVKGSDSYVVVGPSGVYAMEVKARKVFGSRTIEVSDDNELVLGGRISDRRPLQYARAAGDKVRQRFTGASQVQAAVKPLVVFVDDWQINQSDTAVPVLNANQLEQYLGAQPPIFTKSQIAEISSYLD